MKHLRHIFPTAVGALLLTITSCKKESAISQDENQITDEVTKIETTWDGISEKNENDTSIAKIEWRASDKTVEDAMNAVNKKYQEYLSKLGNRNSSVLRLGNVVGVIKNGTNCNGYDELYLGMDCEDSDAQTKWDPAGGNYRPHWDIGGNVALRFCIVPGNDFHAYSYTDANGYVNNFRYAVLRVTTNFYSDAFEANRFFDNEDSRNANSAAYMPWGQGPYNIKSSSDAATSAYRTYIDGNALLSFHVFDASRLTSTTFTQWPNFNGMSYGVFANAVPFVNTLDPDPNSSNNKSILYTDDEDSGNVNSFSVDEDVSQWYPDPSSYSFQSNNPLSSIVDGVYKAGTFFNRGGYIDTEMWLQKVR